jgi:hypothetical protein
MVIVNGGEPHLLLSRVALPLAQYAIESAAISSARRFWLGRLSCSS